jgi:hypothetical protein
MTDDHRQIPEPPRPLKAVGRTLWDDVHSLGEVRGSVEPLLILAEQLDERTGLRQRLAASSEWRDRIGLRQLDDRIGAALRDLGIRSLLPSPGSSGTADDWTVRLARLRGQGGRTYLLPDAEWDAQQRAFTPDNSQGSTDDCR